MDPPGYDNWNNDNVNQVFNTEILEGVTNNTTYPPPIKRNKPSDGITDYSEDLVKRSKKTLPIMTKYERTKMIGARGTQIAHGSSPLVDVTGIKDPIKMAEKEFEEKKIPMMIRRQLPNGVEEVWKIEEFKIIQ